MRYPGDSILKATAYVVTYNSICLYEVNKPTDLKLKIQKNHKKM